MKTNYTFRNGDYLEVEYTDNIRIDSYQLKDGEEWKTINGNHIVVNNNGDIQPVGRLGEKLAGQNTKNVDWNKVNEEKKTAISSNKPAKFKRTELTNKGRGWERGTGETKKANNKKHIVEKKNSEAEKPTKSGKTEIGTTEVRGKDGQYTATITNSKGEKITKTFGDKKQAEDWANDQMNKLILEDKRGLRQKAIQERFNNAKTTEEKKAILNELKAENRKLFEKLKEKNNALQQNLKEENDKLEKNADIARGIEQSLIKRGVSGYQARKEAIALANRGTPVTLKEVEERAKQLNEQPKTEQDIENERLFHIAETRKEIEKLYKEYSNKPNGAQEFEDKVNSLMGGLSKKNKELLEQKAKESKPIADKPITEKPKYISAYDIVEDELTGLTEEAKDYLANDVETLTHNIDKIDNSLEKNYDKIHEQIQKQLDGVNKDFDRKLEKLDKGTFSEEYRNSQKELYRQQAREAEKAILNKEKSQREMAYKEHMAKVTDLLLKFKKNKNIAEEMHPHRSESMTKLYKAEAERLGILPEDMDKFIENKHKAAQLQKQADGKIAKPKGVTKTAINAEISKLSQEKDLLVSNAKRAKLKAEKEQEKVRETQENALREKAGSGDREAARKLGKLYVSGKHCELTKKGDQYYNHGQEISKQEAETILKNSKFNWIGEKAATNETTEDVIKALDDGEKITMNTKVRDYNYRDGKWYNRNKEVSEDEVMEAFK